MKLGILGTGKIVNTVLPVLKQLDIKVYSIFSTLRSADKAKAYATDYGIDQCYTDYDSFLKSNIDTVYVALPNTLHFEYSLKALQAGKHVICEKPITCTVEELQTLNKIAEKNKCILIEAMSIYHMPAFKAMKEKLSEIGDIKLVNLNYSQYSSRYDKFLQGIITPAFDPAKAGGALMDINCYNVHAAVGLFGKPEYFEYYPNMKNNIDTSGTLVCIYKGFMVSCIGAKDSEGKQDSVIQGDKGTIAIKGSVNGMTAFKVYPVKGETEEIDYNEGVHRMYYEFPEFMRIIDENDKEACDILMERSMIATEILETARKRCQQR